MDFNFPPQEGTGIDVLIPHASAAARDLIKKLLIYKLEDRITAREALQHSYFRDLLEADKSKRASPTLMSVPSDEAGRGVQFPPIRAKYGLKKPMHSYVKSTMSNKSITLDQKSPYQTKKIHVDMRKPQRKSFQKSVY